MEVKKELKKYGNNLVLSFTKEEVKSYKLKKGEIIIIKIK